MNLKRQVDKFNASITRKAVIRYLTIVMDFSAACLKSDLRPNRAIVMKDKISVSAQLDSQLLITLVLQWRKCRGSSEGSPSRTLYPKSQPWPPTKRAPNSSLTSSNRLQTTCRKFVNSTSLKEMRRCRMLWNLPATTSRLFRAMAGVKSSSSSLA